MKIFKATYMDDGIYVPGVLIERPLHKPVFYAADSNCGWDAQVITKAEESNVMVWGGRKRARKVVFRVGTEVKE